MEFRINSRIYCVRIHNMQNRVKRSGMLATSVSDLIEEETKPVFLFGIDGGNKRKAVKILR